MVNGFGYVNQTEVKSQYKGCLNICVKLCTAFGETRLDFNTSIVSIDKSLKSEELKWVFQHMIENGWVSGDCSESKFVFVEWINSVCCHKLVFKSVKVNFVLNAIR